MKKKSRMKRKKKSQLAILRDEADKLYQIKLIKEKPKSVISGKPTEVAHHFIPKSQSNNLRYDKKNGVPLTHKEHARHHLSGDPSIVAKILEANGQEWFDDLQARRRIVLRFNKSVLTEIIERLKQDLTTQVDYQKRIEHLKEYGKEEN